VENEYANVARRYGDDGQKYLAWMAELAKRVGLADVPTTMCEGAAKGPIATLNGFEIKPRRVQEYRSRNDHDPMLWTELWPAWYAVWGETRLSRPVEYTRDWTTHCDHDPRTIALSVLVFLANGGAGWSYYMWHGGTNFGRTSMYLQTTSYDFTAPLDEYGRETFKGRYLSHLHEVMQANEEYLLRGERTITIEAEGKQRTAWKLNGRELVVLLDYNVPTAEMPHSRPIAAKVIDPDEKVIFDLLKLHYDLQSSWDAPAWRPLEKASLAWRAWREPMPYARRHESTQSDEPIEQLTLTRDHTDYCWYSTTAAADKAGDRELVIPYGGDYFYVYLDGKLVAQTVAPLLEDRGPITPEDPAHPRVNIHPDNPFVKDGYRHAFHLAGISEGKHRIEILATALGMIKGDWMIESPMNFERKGIWEGVLLNGSPLTGWEMTPFLAGEKKKLVEKSEAGEWSALETAEPLTWYRSTFRLSPQELAQDADFRLNTAGLGKGMLFVNGRGLGRHWLIESPGTGQPTQQYYHLPKSWLREENTLIVFEEQPVTPAKVAIERRAFV
jgi:hypothetical protein